MPLSTRHVAAQRAAIMKVKAVATALPQFMLDNFDGIAGFIETHAGLA
jgi:hypothetical protein